VHSGDEEIIIIKMEAMNEQKVCGVKHFAAVQYLAACMSLRLGP
jgi:hypothetical protein